MDNIEDIIMQIVVPIVTVIFTAIITIQIKYSTTKEEAFSNLKSVGSKVLYYIWLAFLVFILASEVLSDEPLTRASVFKITIYSISLSLLIILRFIDRIISIQAKQIELHDKHLDAFERHLKKSYQETKSVNNEGSNK